MRDVGLVKIFSDTQGRLGTHDFDLVLPPLGLAYLAAVLEGADYDVEIIDGNAELLPDDQLLARISGRFRIVGFYCHTQNFQKILHLAGHLKSSPNPPKIIIGGPHASALPEWCLENAESIDAVVYGEGEVTILELAARLLSGETLEGVRGIAWKSADGKVVKNEPRGYVQDLDSLPMPAWHLLPMHLYRNFLESRGRKVIHVKGSRGCPIDCNYCFSTKMWSPTVRWHSAERMLAEVDHLRENYGIEFFQFLDDNFTLHRERLFRLMDEFRARKLKWCCSTRIDLIDDEVAELLRHGGINHVCIGIESFNDRSLTTVGKRVTRKQTVETLRCCEKYKVPVLGMFILGIPGESLEEAQETVRLTLTHRFHFVVFSYMTVFPGTNFWEQYKNSGLLVDDFSKYNFSRAFNLIDDPERLDRLDALVKKAYLRFFLKPRVFFSIATLFLRKPRALTSAVLSFSRLVFSSIADLLFGSRRKKDGVLRHGCAPLKDDGTNALPPASNSSEVAAPKVGRS